MSGSKSYVSVTVAPDPGFSLTFDSLRGTEELGRPFRYDLELSSGTARPDLTALLGASVTVSIALTETTKRHFNGIVASAAYGGIAGGAYRYRLELRPWIWLLSRVQTCRIFQNQSVWTIITTIFRDAGFSAFSDTRQAQAGDQVLEYCVQYNETALDFVTRLMELYGLYYFFTHADGQHTLVVADDPNSHTALSGAIPYAFDQTDYRIVKGHIWDWSTNLQLQPGAVALQDYNFTTPGADLAARSLQPAAHPYSNFEVYAYPGPYGTASDGEKLVRVRMQHLGAQRQTVSCTSNERRLYAGCKFTLSDFTEKAQNRDYLVVGANYAVDRAEEGAVTEGEIADTFRCFLTAIPGDTPFRLPCRTPWPVMRGPQTAKVVGEQGQDVTTDQYGRIKVKFFWDRTGTQDENASCWIRVAQIWAGTGWGGMYIPRIGQEVVVDFLDGNPDRPLVVGCVYNATTTVPYPLPDNKTRSTIKTRSSPGSGFNELRFEDKAGSEEVFFQAQNDYTKTVLNSETVRIGQDTTTTVDKGNRSVTVSQGSDTLTISRGNHTINVSAGSSTVSAAQSITLKVGPNSITIDTTGVAINGTRIALSASAEMTANGGAVMTLQAGEIAIN